VAPLSRLDDEEAAHDVGLGVGVDRAQNPDRRLPPLSVTRIVRRSRLDLHVADDLSVALHRVAGLRAGDARGREQAERDGRGDRRRDKGAASCGAHYEKSYLPIRRFNSARRRSASASRAERSALRRSASNSDRSSASGSGSGLGGGAAGSPPPASRLSCADISAVSRSTSTTSSSRAASFRSSTTMRSECLRSNSAASRTV